MKTLFDILKEQQSVINTAETRRKIDELNAKLTISDKKVIENAECVAAGLEAPHEPIALHKERQAIREELKTLEKELNENS